MRRVTVKAVYSGDPDEIFAGALKFDEMKSAMAGLATYEGFPEGELEEGATYTIDFLLWRWMKTKSHVIHIERLDRSARELQSREHDATVARWDHRISIQPHENGAIWTDDIVIDAGWLTPFVAWFAVYMYGYRHRSRRALSIERSVQRAG